GEGIYELEVAWHLVVSNLPLTESLQLLSGNLFAGLDPNPRHDLFTVLRIRHADHLHIADFGMGIQKFLDLTRIDVFATANDHILNTAHNVDIAFRVHRCQVPGMHPTSLVNGACGCPGVIPVTQHHTIAT